MSTPAAPPDHARLVRGALWRTLLLPVLLLIFFVAAPYWYSSTVHSLLRDEISASQKIPDAEKAKRLAFFDQLDLQGVCFNPSPRLQRLHDSFVEDDIYGTFERLWWAEVCSIVLVALLAIAMLSMMSLNLDARKSFNSLLSNYRLSWKIAMTTAVIKLVLLIPLLAYGCFEFTVLLSNQYFPKLLLVIVIGGIAALWAAISVLLKKVPLEFPEAMSREITPEEAPELWASIRHAAATVQASPPDRVIVGMQISFYVTELAVRTDTSTVTGRTLFLSYPLLKQLSTEEVLGIIGHELGHFKSNDTRMTREFYPLRLKVGETIMALARAGWVGWPSWGLLAFFNLTFEKTIQRLSRQRELLADQVGASLTSPDIMSRGLIKFSVLNETLQRMLSSPAGGQIQNPMAIRWQSFIGEKILADDPFWTQLGEKKLPHPLDSHPPLQDRLAALGDTVHLADARDISLQGAETAYDAWFAGRDDLFTELAAKVDNVIGEIRKKARLADADYSTEEGKQMLEESFPELRWRKKGSGHFVGLVLFGIIALFSLLIMFVVPGWVAKGFLAALVALFIWIAWVAWKSRKDEVVLTAVGVFTTPWKRTLLFTEVESIALRQVNSVLQVHFKLKQRQEQISKWAVPMKAKVYVLSISTRMNEKPIVIAQTIYRYFARQPVEKPE